MSLGIRVIGLTNLANLDVLDNFEVFSTSCTIRTVSFSNSTVSCSIDCPVFNESANNTDAPIASNSRNTNTNGNTASISSHECFRNNLNVFARTYLKNKSNRNIPITIQSAICSHNSFSWAKS